MNTAKAQGKAWGLSLSSADHWLKPGKNVMCLMLSIMCVDVSGTRRSDLTIHCCQKGIASLFPPVFHMEPCSLQSLHGGSGAWWGSSYHSSVLNGLSYSSSCQISEMNWIPGGDWIYQHSLPPTDCILLSNICGKVYMCQVLDVCYSFQVLESFGFSMLKLGLYLDLTGYQSMHRMSILYWFGQWVHLGMVCAWNAV